MSKETDKVAALRGDLHYINPADNPEAKKVAQELAKLVQDVKNKLVEIALDFNIDVRVGNEWVERSNEWNDSGCSDDYPPTGRWVNSSTYC